MNTKNFLIQLLHLKHLIHDTIVKFEEWRVEHVLKISNE